MRRLIYTKTMIIRQLAEQISGFRHIVDGLELGSGLARRVLLDSPVMTSARGIEAELESVSRTVAMACDAARTDAFSAIAMRLGQIKDLRGTVSRLAAGRTLDDVELFEVKVFAMTAAAVRKAVNDARIDVVEVPDTGAIVELLDPDGAGIPHFAIYDAYSPELMDVRRRLRLQKTPDLYDENARLEDEIRVRLSAELSVFASLLDETAAAVARLDILIAKARGAIEWGFCRPEIAGAPEIAEDCRGAGGGTWQELSDKRQSAGVGTGPGKGAGWCTDGEAGPDNAYLSRVGSDGKARSTTGFNGLFNPVVREALRARGRDFQPVDIALHEGPTVITGANMGGKTVLLKSVALAQALCQAGFYVPAERAKIVPVDEILTSIGDAQNEMIGLSSFAAEMVRLNDIIGRIRGGKRALVLIDEPARTTNPVEGEAIVNALLDLLARHKVMALVTTHYGGIRAGVERMRVRGFSQDAANVTAENIQDSMDYSLVADEGHPPHEALRIARILGVDGELIDRAAEYMK